MRFAYGVRRGEGFLLPMSVGKTTRFKVFDRDDFKCRYCGRTPDDGITLEVDHIKPRSKGGGDEVENLATSCFDCNRGKSDKDLGSAMPETDAVRWKRLQELAELKRATKELAAVAKQRRSIHQKWVDEICSASGYAKCDAKFAKAAVKLSTEFPLNEVFTWVDATLLKFEDPTNTNCAKYLYGIARRVREAQAV